MSIFRLTTQEAKERLELLEDKLSRITQESTRANVPWETSRLLGEYRDLLHREKRSIEINYPLSIPMRKIIGETV